MSDSEGMRQLEFEIVLFGYDRREVDALFARAEAVRGSHDASARSAVSAQLAGAALRTRLQGYSKRPVDAALQQLARGLTEPA